MGVFEGPDNSGSRGVSAEEVSGMVATMMRSTVQNETPGSGDTITSIGGTRNRSLVIKGSGEVSGLIIVMPPEAASQADCGRVFRVTTRRPISSMSWSGGTLLGETSSLQTNESVSYEEIEPGLWACIASTQ